MSRSSQLSRAKVQLDVNSGQRKPGRPTNYAKFLKAQRDLFPVELAVACWAPHLIQAGAGCLPARSGSEDSQATGAGALGIYGENAVTHPERTDDE